MVDTLKINYLGEKYVTSLRSNLYKSLVLSLLFSTYFFYLDFPLHTQTFLIKCFQTLILKMTFILINDFQTSKICPPSCVRSHAFNKFY